MVPTPTGPYAALQHPNFRRYIIALAAFTMAVQIQGTVVGWQIYELTHDKLALGMIGLAEALPFIGFALYAGHVADRHDRRSVAMIALSVLVLCSLSLLSLPLLLSHQPRRVTGFIYLTIIISGVARSFLQPARQALSQELVPRSLFHNAVTWRSGAWQLAAVMGPAAGGALYAIGGTTAAYTGDALLVTIGLLAIISIRHRSEINRDHTDDIGASLTEGVRFVFKEPILLSALSLDLFSVFFGGATALLPVFADEILHVGPQGLGMLRAAPALGAVVMSLVIVHRPPFERAGRTLAIAVAGFGIFTIGFGLSTSFWLSLAMLALAGASDMVSVSIRSNLLQTITPTHLFGRVSSVNSVFVGSSNEIGMFESGVTAQLFGTVPSVLLGGAATLVVVTVIFGRNAALRGLGRIHELAERAGSERAARAARSARAATEAAP
ncbi:MAG: MFS transporter [Gemmatimonadaceae bacterium]|nr:MFS transporter [Gemmatimonadaceae bacterium]